jgi:hypothetical protein
MLKQYPSPIECTGNQSVGFTVINPDLIACAKEHPELYTGSICGKCGQNWISNEKCPLTAAALPLSMKQYYLISLKHTSKGDSALTFWCADGCGYTWHKDRAGLYSEEEVIKCECEDSVRVEKSLVDPFWMNAIDYSDKYVSVPNNAQVLHALGIEKAAKIYMKPKKFAGCRMQFINTPVNLQPC